jgi:hypothetical protein
MPFDDQFALDTMLPLAEAAYDLTKLPKSWKLVAPIQPGNFGFVAVDETGAVVIAFPGTRTEGQWLEDFDGLAVPNAYGQGMVHQGFQNQYKALRASVLAALAQVNLLPATSSASPFQIWITGHSLGASLATLCASDIALAGKSKLVYTWAGPRVGWHDYARWFATLGIQTYRIVNEWDVVPRVPSVVNGYEHVGAEIAIDGGRPETNEHFLATAHSLQLSYGPGVARLMLPKAA